jgi:hypothetical protein
VRVLSSWDEEEDDDDEGDEEEDEEEDEEDDEEVVGSRPLLVEGDGPRAAAVPS